MIQILHNSRCGKSRNCVAFITELKVPFEIIAYLENPLTASDLEVLIKKLAIKPIELVRQKEPIWIANYKGKVVTDSDIIQALAQHPILIERPIVIDGDKAIIAREIEKLATFLQ